MLIKLASVIFLDCFVNDKNKLADCLEKHFLTIHMRRYFPLVTCVLTTNDLTPCSRIVRARANAEAPSKFDVIKILAFLLRRREKYVDQVAYISLNLTTSEITSSRYSNYTVNQTWRNSQRNKRTNVFQDCIKLQVNCALFFYGNGVESNVKTLKPSLINLVRLL